MRILYGLSPIIANPFQLKKHQLFQALMRDLKSDQDQVPGLMTLLVDSLDVKLVEVPTDDYYLQELAKDTVNKSDPWFKIDSANDAMQPNQKEERNMMKFVPVPLYVVLDCLEQNLSAGEMFECIKFIDDVDNKEYLKHAISFCKGCETIYGACARDKRPTIAAGVLRGCQQMPTKHGQ